MFKGALSSCADLGERTLTQEGVIASEQTRKLTMTIQSTSSGSSTRLVIVQKSTILKELHGR